MLIGLVLSFFIFVLSGYTTKAMMFIIAHIVWPVVLFYAVFFLVINKKKIAKRGVEIAVVCFILDIIGANLTPIEWMDEDQRGNLPCLGYVDSDFEPFVKGFPKLQYTDQRCKSVIHAGHGSQTEAGHSILVNGKRIYTKNIVSRYPAMVKKHFVMSCRGTKETTAFDLPFSFGFEQKSIEKEGEKEIWYFARKGTYQVANKWLLWD